jgi:formate-dependent nitrite reductase membrane component NrfD
MGSEEIKLELNKFSLEQAKHDADLKHKWEQESHWKWQRWFWVGVVVLGVVAQIISFLSSKG